MKDLIQRITQSAGISEEQAAKALETIKDYVKENFPLISSMMRIRSFRKQR